MEPISPRERVRRAIGFTGPDRVPLLYLNKDPLDGDILICGALVIQDGETGLTEWGVRFKSLDDGTMGQMADPPIRRWSDLPGYRFPQPQEERRRRALRQFAAETGDYYRLASLGLSGFTCYCGLRGFQNAMTDFALEPKRAFGLFGKILEFEKWLMSLAAGEGLDGVILWDDWGRQDALIVAPEMWREYFKPYYRDQCRHAHELGLTVWFHCCGRIDAIIPDFHEIGIDVINISQPNVVDVERIGTILRGRQCFMVPISYQTVSISGTPEDIHREARRLYGALGTPQGGFIGYIEDYGCMGMSERNYEACRTAFLALRAGSEQ